MKKENETKHLWSIICSSSTVDTETKNISLSNLIERVTLSVPDTELKKAKKENARGLIFPFTFEVVTRFMKVGEKIPSPFFYRVSMFSPEGEKMLSSNEQEIIFKKEMINMRIRTKFDQLPVEETGTYKLAIETKAPTSKDYKEIDSVPLEIILNILPKKD